MPAKNRIKQYEEHSFYHLYNRGVEKRLIFLDQQDFSVYLSYLKTYLEPKDIPALTTILANPNSSSKEKDAASRLLRLNNFSDILTLFSFCLMPNHFHFLIKQTEINTIDVFMNSMSTRYSMYFNKKYKRVGPLFQGVYKAVLVSTDEQLFYLTRYIHRNPFKLIPKGQALQGYPYSSYPFYIKNTKLSWLHKKDILALYSQNEDSYKNFVEDTDAEEKAQVLISSLQIDEDA